MISGPSRSGSLYWLTSVPQTPATSTFISAASGGMSGRSSSRSSVVDGAVFNAASTFSDTRKSSSNLYANSGIYVLAREQCQRDATTAAARRSSAAFSLGYALRTLPS